MSVATLREPTFEAVALGEEIGPLFIVADRHYQRNACFAVDDYSVDYISGEAHSQGRLVPQTAVARNLVALFCEVYDPCKVVGLHQREEIWFHKTIPLGTRMALTGRYIDKYERRGKGYVVFEAEARDAETGDLLVRQISIEIMRIPDGVQLGSASAPPPERRVSGIWPAHVEPLAREDKNLSVGRPVQPLTKTAYQDQMSVFSGADNQWTNIHTDVRIARAAGFRDTLAQGVMESCWTSEMLANAFGPAWFSTGWISHVYLKPVFRGDTITCRGVITGLETLRDGRQVELEIWAENQSGVMTAAGWARVIV